MTAILTALSGATAIGDGPVFDLLETSRDFTLQSNCLPLGKTVRLSLKGSLDGVYWFELTTSVYAGGAVSTKVNAPGLPISATSLRARYIKVNVSEVESGTTAINATVAVGKID